MSDVIVIVAGDWRQVTALADKKGINLRSRDVITLTNAISNYDRVMGRRDIKKMYFTGTWEDRFDFDTLGQTLTLVRSANPNIKEYEL